MADRKTKQPEPTAVLRFMGQAQKMRVGVREAYEIFQQAGGVMRYRDFRRLWRSARDNPMRFRGAE